MEILEQQDPFYFCVIKNTKTLTISISMPQSLVYLLIIKNHIWNQVLMALAYSMEYSDLGSTKKQRVREETTSIVFFEDN